MHSTDSIVPSRVKTHVWSWIAVILMGASSQGQLAEQQAILAPIHHQPFWCQEPELFGYTNDVDAAPVGFDVTNRPYSLKGDCVVTLDEAGRVQYLPFAPFIKAQYPSWNGVFSSGAFSESHIVFDAADHAYILVNASRSNIQKVLLLQSRDHCRTWTVYPVCSGGSNTFATIENRDGNSELQYPPAIVVGDREWIGSGMRLVIVEKGDGGALTIRAPVTVADEAYIIPIHSGGGNTVISVRDNIHCFWASGRPRPGCEESGTPQYARTYNRKTGTWTSTVLLGYGGTGKPDDHDLPAVSADSKGYLHVLLGAHHDRFKYTMSLKPDSVVDGWTEPAPIGVAKAGANGSYTYIGLVCDRDDTLHAVSRWAGDGYFFKLVYMRKKKGSDWEPHQVLVSPFKSMYSCWYQKVSVDRQDRIFCGYVYFGAQLDDEQTAAFCQKFPSERNWWYLGAAGLRSPALLVSENHGSSWRLTSFNTISGKAPCPGALEKDDQRVGTVDRSAVPSGQLGGAVTVGPVWGDKMILGIGSKLAVLSLTNSGSPRLESQSDLVESDVCCSAVKGGYVYAGVGKRLVVFKLDEWSSPVVSGSVMLPRRAIKVQVHKELLFVSCEKSLEIFDVTVPAKPAPVSRWNTTDAYDFEVRDDTLYLAAGEDGIRILDIKAPAKVQLVGALPAVKGDNATSAYSLTVAGDILFSGPSACGVVVRACDISNPASPRELSRFKRTTWSWGRKVLVQGGIAYYPGPDAVYILDVNDPRDIKELGKISAGGDVRELRVNQDYLYAGMGRDGVEVLRISNPRVPVKVGRYEEPVCPWGIAIDGSLALLADWKKGLFLLDVSQPTKPTVLGLLAKQQVDMAVQKKSVLRAARKGNIVFLATGQEGLWSVDISNTSELKITRKLAFNGGVRDVVVSGDLAFVAEEKLGVRILNVRNPNCPEIVGRVESGREVLSLAVSGNILFAGQAMWGGRSHIVGYDVANPHVPREVCDYVTRHDVWGLDAAGGRLYAAEASQGVEVIDVADPKAPKYIETLRVPGTVWSVCLTEHTAYYACGKAGLLYQPLVPVVK